MNARGILPRNRNKLHSLSAAARHSGKAPTGTRSDKMLKLRNHNEVILTTTPLPPPLQHGLGGGQSTLDVVEHNLHDRFHSLTRSGARLPPLSPQNSSPQTPSRLEHNFASPSSRHAHNPPSSSSPLPLPSSSRLPTSASSSPAAMLQAAAAALADAKNGGTASAISAR